jgi:pectate lyase
MRKGSILLTGLLLSTALIISLAGCSGGGGSSGDSSGIISPAASASPSSGSSFLFFEDFQDGVADGFTSTGTWIYPTDGSIVYNGTGTSAFGSYAGSSSWTDYTLSMKLKVTAQGGSKKVYVLGHATAANTGWGLEINTNSTTAWKINAGKLNGGTFTAGSGCSQLTGTSYANDTWYTVSIIFSGTTITVAIDGVTKFTFSDAASTSGMLAVYSDRDTFSIDDVGVYGNGTVSPSASPSSSADPSASPTASATASATASTSPTPTPSANPSPLPSPTGTITVQGNIVFTTYGGWFESAYAEWQTLSDAAGYIVSYKLASDSTYTLADNALVRGARVVLPGLLGNATYDVKIVPYDFIGVEHPDQASVAEVSTLSYDRSGFAFLPGSPNGTTNGGYNTNGTVKSGAGILYIDDTTKDTVTMAVTKGSTTTTYTGLANIMKARESAKSTVPLIIRFFGTVNPPTGDAYSSGLLDVKANSNVTLEGIGNDALLYGWGINIRAATNIEVRNLSFYMFPDDSVSIQTDNRNIWVHNNDFRIGADGGGDKALGDGSCDIKDNSSYITVSYNHFIGTGKSSLCGLNEGSEFFVTYHHNYFDESHSRHPRVRVGTIHVYNNYFKGQTTYSVGAAEASSVFVQNNTFENCVRPMIIASQGHDFKDLVPAGNTAGAHESILSGENGGTIKAEGNVLDAFSASWFDASVDTGNATVGGAVYNNFESNFSTNSYPYLLDTAETSKTNILNYAGRLK